MTTRPAPRFGRPGQRCDLSGAPSDNRPIKAQHTATALLRQSICSRLAGSEDLNAADRLRSDPALRPVVGGRARDHTAASTGEIARFETETLTSQVNLHQLMDLSGRWIDHAHRHRKLTRLVLAMDSSVSAIPGQHQGAGGGEPWEGRGMGVAGEPARRRSGQ